MTMREETIGIVGCGLIADTHVEAIREALTSARAGDIVVTAGKGHEDYQIIGKQKFDFSDKAVALEYLTKRK